MFSARLAGDQPMEIFSASLAWVGRPYPTRVPGAGRVELSRSAGSIFSFRISPDGRRVVFQDTTSERRLFSVPIAGGPAVELSGDVVAGGSVHLDDYAISPDSSRVVYRAEQDVDGTSELYSVPLDVSSPPLQLNPPLVAGGDVWSFEISPDSSLVVYNADQDTDGRIELHSVPLDGSAPAVKILATEPGESFPHVPFRIGPDGERVVSLSAVPRGNQHAFELRSIPLVGGGEPAKLNGVHVDFDDKDEEPEVYEYRISSDRERVVYLTDEDEDDVFELYSSPLVVADPARVRRTAPLPVQLSRPLPDNGEVGDNEERAFNFDISADGTRVVYRATQEDPEVYELFTVAIDRSRGPVKLNPTLAIGDIPSDVDAFAVSPDSARVVYRADQETDALNELYSVPGDAGAPAVKLSGPGMHEAVREFRVSADSARVAYLARRNGSVALFGAALDGQGGPVELSGELVVGEDVQFFEMAGGRVVYLADQEGQNLQELFSVPIDASAPAVQLNGTLAPGGFVSSFEVQPGGTHVVYSAQQDPAVMELFRVPIQGGVEPSRISAPLVPGGNVMTGGPAPFRSSPDSRFVVYRADLEVNERFELFAAEVVHGPLAARMP